MSPRLAQLDAVQSVEQWLPTAGFLAILHQQLSDMMRRSALVCQGAPKGAVFVLCASARVSAGNTLAKYAVRLGAA